MIKAVFIDIDGTLLNSKKQVTINTRKKIKECIENNVKIILVSGRSRLFTMNIQKEIESSPYIISSNGAEIYDIKNNKILYSDYLNKEVLENLLEYANSNNLKISFIYESDLVMNKYIFSDEKDKVKSIEEIKQIINSENILQCVISDINFEKMEKARTFLKKNFKEVKITNESKRFINEKLKSSSSYFCDITSKTVSKGVAVKELCRCLDFKKEEIVVIGDGKNDISMFELTENSVAMGNALDELKIIAKYVTDSNDEDGVVKILAKILNNNL